MASLPAIRSERSTLCACTVARRASAERREAREKGFDFIMIGERYKTDTTSVFRAVREG